MNTKHTVRCGHSGARYPIDTPQTKFILCRKCTDGLQARLNAAVTRTPNDAIGKPRPAHVSGAVSGPTKVRATSPRSTRTKDGTPQKVKVQRVKPLPVDTDAAIRKARSLAITGTWDDKPRTLAGS